MSLALISLQALNSGILWVHLLCGNEHEHGILRLAPLHAAVSKAFSCLSDGDKRAAYDRYGSETPGLMRRTQGGRGPFGAQGEVDPEELFNMFFNGGFGGPFGGGPFGGPG